MELFAGPVCPSDDFDSNWRPGPFFADPDGLEKLAGKWRGSPVLTGSKSTSSSFFDWGRLRQFGYTQNWGLNFKAKSYLKVFSFFQYFLLVIAHESRHYHLFT